MIFVVILWVVKSRRRKREHFERKNSLRASLRSNRVKQLAIIESERMKQLARDSVRLQPPPSPDFIDIAHKKLVRGNNGSQTASHGSTPRKISPSTSTYTEGSTTETTTPTTYLRSSKSYTSMATQSGYPSDYPTTDRTTTVATSSKYLKRQTPEGQSADVRYTSSVSSFKPHDVKKRHKPSDLSLAPSSHYTSGTSYDSDCTECNKSPESHVSHDPSARRNSVTSSCSGTFTGSSTRSSTTTLTDAGGTPTPHLTTKPVSLSTEKHGYFSGSTTDALAEENFDDYLLQGGTMSSLQHFSKRVMSIERPPKPPPKPPSRKASAATVSGYPNPAFSGSAGSNSNFTQSNDSIISETSLRNDGRPYLSSFRSQGNMYDRPKPLETAM